MFKGLQDVLLEGFILKGQSFLAAFVVEAACMAVFYYLAPKDLDAESILTFV